MGLSGISKSQVSKLCKDIDERVNAFLDRPIEGEWPYLWLDATYLKVRDRGRIVSVAAIIAVAVDTEGRREIVGLGIGPSEAEPFWSTFPSIGRPRFWLATTSSGGATELTMMPLGPNMPPSAALISTRWNTPVIALYSVTVSRISSLM
jgi:hypothetical protein